MPLGSLRDQLTFPDSAGRTNPAPGESPGDTGGSAVRRHSGSGGGDSDSGEEDAGTLPARAVGGGARRLPLVRSGPAAAGYRRVASSKGIGTSAEAPRGPDVSGPGRLCASPALDAELRELLSTVCLPNLLARQAGWWSTGWGGCEDPAAQAVGHGMCCLAHVLHHATNPPPDWNVTQGGRPGCGGRLGAHAVPGRAAARFVCAPPAP